MKLMFEISKSTKQISRLTEFCGVKTPEISNRKPGKSIDNDEETTKFDIKFATEQTNTLLENDVPRIHLYSLNKNNQVKMS